MRQALPVITADAATLKQHLQRAYDGRKRPRLQMLYLLASGQAHTRQEVAQLLGVQRHTIGHWLTISASEGLDVLLALYVPAGKPLSLPPDVLARDGPGSPATSRFCRLRRPTPVGQADPSPGGQLPHPLHARPHEIEGQAQGPPAQPHQKPLTPFLRARRRGESGCSASSRPRTPAPGGCSVRTTVAVAY
jgi:Homeodomain-like domain